MTQQQIKITDLLERHHVIPGLPAKDKGQVLGELAERAGIALKVDARKIADVLHAREQLGSTGVGHGIAIPHARVAGLKQLFGLFARLDHAIDFAAVDAAPVDLIFLLLIPADSKVSHLPALAAISRRLRDQATARAIRGADTAKDIFDLLAGGPV